MKNRNDIPRLSLSLPVTFEAHGASWRGVAVNISKKGLCLRTDSPLSEEDLLDLVIEGPGRSAIPIKGRVRWVLELSPFFQPIFPLEAGIFIEESSKDFEELFNTNTAVFLDYREDPRVTKPMRVELAGPGFWEATFAMNIGRRGLFIRTDQSVAPGQMVEVGLYLTDSERPVHIKGIVVHVLNEERCVSIGAEPGIGVKFISMPSGFRERINKYMDELEQRYRT